jgi:hypothetical protein
LGFILKINIISLINSKRGYLETGKLVIIAALALISLFVSVYVLWESPWTGFRFIYVFVPHLYLIPIILLALWFPKSGLRLLITILVLVFSFWILASVFGYQFSISFVLLYSGLDLAAIMVLLLYVKDRRLVEAVITDLMERSDRKRSTSDSRFGGDFDAIIAALASKDERDREEAADALSDLADERAVLPLIRLLDDTSPYVRRAAADALGKSGSFKAVQPLLKALTDNDRYVRETASEALGHLGDPAIPALLKSIDDENWRIRIGVIVAIRVSSGTIPSLDPIIRSLHDESPYVRREAVKTLGRIGDETDVPYLIQATKDPDPGVRLRAVRAVVKHGKSEDVVPVLKRCMQDSDVTVRMRAGEELIKMQGLRDTTKIPEMTE